jgi:Putative Actinobacterial Holin-X, holin superfamily III
VDGPAATEEAASRSVPPGGGPRPTLHRLIGSFADASGARVRLFEAEFRRAAWASVYMGAMAIAAALLLVTAWLIFAASLVYAAVNVGLPWWLGALVVVAAHLGTAFLLMQRVHAYVDRMSFAATRRSFAFRARAPE